MFQPHMYTHCPLCVKHHVTFLTLTFSLFCSWKTTYIIILRGHPGGRHGRSYLPKLSHFSLFQAQGEVVLHRIYRKNIAKDYHFSSKLKKTIKTSPCITSDSFFFFTFIFILLLGKSETEDLNFISISDFTKHI